MKKQNIAAVMFALLSTLSLPAQAASPSKDNSSFLNFYEDHISSDMLTPKGIERVQNYVTAHPGDLRAQFILGMIMDTMGFENLGLERFAYCDSHSKDFVLNKMHEELRRENLVYPVRLLRYLGNKYPEDPAVLFTRAYNYLRLRQAGKALTAFEKAAAVPHPWPGTYSCLSHLLYDQGRLDEALKYATLALKETPGDMNALRVETLTRLRHGATAASQKEALDRLAHFAPTDAPVHFYEAQELVARDQFNQAIEPAVIGAGWAETPEQVKEATALCRIIFSHVPTAEVAAVLDRVSPVNRPDLMNTLLRLRVADIYSDMGNHDAATEQLLKSLKMSDVLAPRINYRLSQEYSKVHRDKLAYMFAAVAHKLRPEDDEINKSMQRCENVALNHSNDLARRLKSLLR